MNNRIAKAGITLSILTSSFLYATNGDSLISVGAKSRGMGGTGIAISHGAESTLVNPALITKVENSEISFGGTVFMPDMSTSMGQAPYYDSDADMNVIPEVSIAHKINENWYVGIGMWGTAGMGVDYRNAHTDSMDSGNMNMVTNLQLMQFGVPIAYKYDGLSVAITPILQYGALDIAYNDFMGNSVGDGIAQDLEFGYSMGATYDFATNGIDGLVLGLVYKSKIDMDYSNQLSKATQPFVDVGIFPSTMQNHLEQPEEIGLGIAYSIENHSFAFDYKQIAWSDAKGYQDFGWQDQDVYAFGYEYSQDDWALRAGYNYSSNPLTEAPSGPQVIPAGSYAMAGGNALNLFNLLGFPATAEEHYTIGGTYAYSEEFSIDLAYVYSPKITTTMDTIVGINPQTGDMYIGPSSVEHTENSISFQLTYKF
jgi:long-chain fatty acid transport protein